MAPKDGGPAFPVVFEHSESTSEQTGMSLLDHFATAVVEACMYFHRSDMLEECDETREDLYARKAYDMAAAMLKAKAKREQSA